MRRFVFENGLTLFFGTIFLGALAGQSLAGQRAFNDEQQAHGEPTVSWADYVLSSDFGRAVMENWQSEYLQFTLFILATIWLVQRGSNESKPPEYVGLESDQKQQVGGYAPADGPRWAKTGGWRTLLYGNSLLVVMLVIFAGSWFAQSVTAWTVFNEGQREHDQATVSWAGYLAEPDFWEQTLQNWQSEFLAIASMVIFTVYLRQRGSPESKPVGAPHRQTGTSG
ncbi:MAG: DUF6766 family protein [Gaiellaceae bacterium]